MRTAPGDASLAFAAPELGHPLWSRFGLWFLGSLLALVITFGVSVMATGRLGWTVGFLYIVYDTWLLVMMLRASRRAVLGPAPEVTETPVRPTLAVLIAARNEAPVIVGTVEAVLGQTDPPEQVVVVDDGSTDETLARLCERFRIERGGDARLGRSEAFPRLRVLTKANSGKARSLNEALALCDADVVLTLDADTRLEPTAIGAVRQAFARSRRLTVACGAITPTCRRAPGSALFQLYQTFEYLHSFLWRVAWASRRSLLLVSGAFAAFRRDALLAVGGFDPDSMVEDYEVMFRLHRRSVEAFGEPLEVRVLPDARALTDAPGRAGAFLRQRQRWFAGFVETLFRHRDLVGNPRYGQLGTFHLLVKTLDTLLPLYGLAATAALGWLLVRGRGLPSLVLEVLLAKFAFDFCCHLYSLFLAQRWQSARVSPGLFTRAALATLSEPFFFQPMRQLGALIGWVAFLRGRVEWTPQRERWRAPNSATSPGPASSR
jgi:cellulose synthase/poly-beta-1,6-N-acetylglucosamine synthase-like glycosyltransferase